MAEREKGVATTTCPNCGNELSPTELPDGGTTYETCPNCYNDQAPAEAPVKQEKASRSISRETGTEITREEDN